MSDGRPHTTSPEVRTLVTWLAKVTSEQALTGGGKVAWRRTLAKDLSLQTSVEVARSYYASLSGEPLPPARAKDEVKGHEIGVIDGHGADPTGEIYCDRAAFHHVDTEV